VLIADMLIVVEKPEIATGIVGIVVIHVHRLPPVFALFTRVTVIIYQIGKMVAMTGAVVMNLRHQCKWNR